MVAWEEPYGESWGVEDDGCDEGGRDPLKEEVVEDDAL